MANVPGASTPAQAQKLYPTPQSFAAYLNQHWPGKRITAGNLPGNNVGDQWTNWYKTQSAKNPGHSLGSWEMAFFEIVAVQSLGPAVGQAVTATATATQQVAQGTASGLSDFLSRLTEGSLWLRVAEVGLGLLLIAVGVAQMTNAVPVATKLAAYVK